MTDLNARAILTHRFAQAIFHRALVTHRRHIDKVDNDQAAQVAQAQLTRDLIGRFQVGVECGLFDIAAARGARRVNVDSGQRFGAVDNDRAARRQAHFALEGGLDLRFDLIVAEQRDLAGVKLDFAAEIGTPEGGDMLARQLEHFRVVDQDFADVLAQIVAEGAHDNVAFLVDQERSRAVFSGFFNRFPVFQTEAQVPLQRLGGFAYACGTYDQAHAVRQLQR